MSCSLCRLPFIPTLQSRAPRWLLQGIISEKQFSHFNRAIALGLFIPGLVTKAVCMDRNFFLANNSPTVTAAIWEYDGTTFIALHNHCSTLLRHHTGLTSDSTETLIEFSLLEKILGRPQGLALAGRFKDFDYENILGDDAGRVDIESLWSQGDGDGLNDFDWNKWKLSGLEWTGTCPDVFPRFHPAVSPARLDAIGPLPKDGTSDVITTLPHDVLVLVLEHPALPNAAFVALLGTCRTLRHVALTVLQPLARARVLALRRPLAVPAEYDAFVARARSTGTIGDPDKGSRVGEDETGLRALEMAHATHSPAHGDWMLYLSQVHRTQAMRARRWLWALAEGLAALRTERRAASQWAELPGEAAEAGDSGEGGWMAARRSDAWKKYAEEARHLLMAYKLMNALSGNVGNVGTSETRW